MQPVWPSAIWPLSQHPVTVLSFVMFCIAASTAWFGGCSKRVGALDSKVDVLSADLASQGAKLDSLENTCKDVIQVGGRVLAGRSQGCIFIMHPL